MSKIDNTKSPNEEFSSISSDFQPQTNTAENQKSNILSSSFPFIIKEEPVSPCPVNSDFRSAVPVSEVKLKIKRVKLRNNELRKNNLCQETELHNYQLRLSKYKNEVVYLKNEISTFKTALDVATQTKFIFKNKICKTDADLKQFKQHVQKYIKNEKEFTSSFKLLESEKRKLRKTERDILRVTKLLETRTNMMKHIRKQMKTTQSTLLEFGRILNDNDNKLSSKHKKYMKTVEEEYLKDSYCDDASNDIAPEMEQDADDLQGWPCAELLSLDLPLQFTNKRKQQTIPKDMNMESCRNSQCNKPLANSICSTSKISSTSCIPASIPESNYISNKGGNSNTCEDHSNSNSINTNVIIHSPTNFDSGILKNVSKSFGPIASPPDSFFTTKNTESVSKIISVDMNVNQNKGDINDSFNREQFCSISSAKAPISTVKQEENDGLIYSLINVKDEPVSPDSDDEIFQSTVSASEVAMRIQRLKHENEELKTKNVRQESELRNYELRLSKRLTELFHITNERNSVKEALDKVEEEKCTLEIRLGEREAELKQFKELVQKYIRYEDDVINIRKELENIKKILEKSGKELLHATNILKTRTTTLKKIRGKERKAHNTILLFGKILNEKGIEITSNQKKYLKAIGVMHLKDTDQTEKVDKETIVPKVEKDADDYLQSVTSVESLSIDISFIKQENISDIPEKSGYTT